MRHNSILPCASRSIVSMYILAQRKISIHLLSMRNKIIQKPKLLFKCNSWFFSPRSNSFFATKCHLDCQRNIAGPGMERAKGPGWAGWCTLQCHLQEVPARAGNVLTLWRQRRHLATPPRADPTPRDSAQPASSHAVQLWDPGGQQCFQQEPVYTSVLYSKHHHKSGWYVKVLPQTMSVKLDAAKYQNDTKGGQKKYFMLKKWRSISWMHVGVCCIQYFLFEQGLRRKTVFWMSLRKGPLSNTHSVLSTNTAANSNSEAECIHNVEPSIFQQPTASNPPLYHPTSDESN